MGSDALRKDWSRRGVSAVSRGGSSCTRGANRRARRAVEPALARSGALPRGARFVCAGAVAALLACGARAPECHSERCNQKQIDVMTWWPNTGNSPGASLEEAAEDLPGVTVNLMDAP